ncbi:hypothetical protein C8R43DRAFT_949321 [Mycena crocata]|nr:hypothetical protein C8R43DRAFT_949321 [Mycena crocata]
MATVRFVDALGYEFATLSDTYTQPKRMLKKAINITAREPPHNDNRYTTDGTKKFIRKRRPLNTDSDTSVNSAKKLGQQIRTLIDGTKIRYGPAPAGSQSANGIKPPKCLNPSLEDFINHVPGTIPEHPAAGFDRDGRGMCRVVHGHPGYETYTAIAKIFASRHMPVRLAVLNDGAEPDNDEDDLDRLGPEWREAFPPIDKEEKSPPATGNKKQGSSKRRKTNHLITDKADDEMANSVVIMEASDSDMVTSGSKSRYPHRSGAKNVSVSTAPRESTCALPLRPKPRRPSDLASVTRFLSNIDGFDLSQWAPLFKPKGLGTMSELAIAGRMNKERLVGFLHALFDRHDMPEGYILCLADALRGLNQQ